MFIIDAFVWWYGRGWGYLGRRSLRRLKRISESFSIIILLKTLFSPFRETLTDAGQGSLGDRLRAFGDRVISRCIGFVVRICIIVASVFVLFITLVVTIVNFVIWPFIPLAPLIGIVIFAMHGVAGL